MKTYIILFTGECEVTAKNRKEARQKGIRKLKDIHLENKGVISISEVKEFDGFTAFYIGR